MCAVTDAIELDSQPDYSFPSSPTPNNTGNPFGTTGLYKPQANTLTLDATASGKQSGSDNMAKIHRAQWEDYKSRFAPVEDMLFERFNDTTNKNEAVRSAADTMAGAFDRSEAQTNRELSRYGLNVPARQRDQRSTTMGLRKAAAVAGAKNSMRTAKEDQKMAVMSGGLSTVASQRSN